MSIDSRARMSLRPRSRRSNGSRESWRATRLGLDVAPLETPTPPSAIWFSRFHGSNPVDSPRVPRKDLEAKTHFPPSRPDRPGSGSVPLSWRPLFATAINPRPAVPRPRFDGSRWPENANPTRVLRTALRRAGIVESYIHKCRRKGCGHSEASQDGCQRRCPSCRMKLWAHGQVLQLRFHDLRHTTAALMLRLGASPAAVQKILRHADIRTTLDTYGHLGSAHDFLQREVDRLSFGTAAPEARDSGPFASPVLPTLTRGLQHDDPLSPQLPEITPTLRGRGDRIRTCDIRLPKPARYQLRYAPSPRWPVRAKRSGCYTGSAPDNRQIRRRWTTSGPGQRWRRRAARARKAAARWDSWFFSARSISAMVLPWAGRKNSGS
jgi:hypothetical protein